MTSGSLGTLCAEGPLHFKEKDYSDDLLHSPYLQQGKMRCLLVIPGKRAMLKLKAYLGLQVVRETVLSAEQSRWWGEEEKEVVWCCAE